MTEETWTGRAGRLPGRRLPILPLGPELLGVLLVRPPAGLAGLALEECAPLFHLHGDGWFLAGWAGRTSGASLLPLAPRFPGRRLAATSDGR